MALSPAAPPPPPSFVPQPAASSAGAVHRHAFDLRIDDEVKAECTALKTHRPRTPFIRPPSSSRSRFTRRSLSWKKLYHALASHCADPDSRGPQPSCPPATRNSTTRPNARRPPPAPLRRPSPALTDGQAVQHLNKRLFDPTSAPSPSWFEWLKCLLCRFEKSQPVVFVFAYALANLRFIPMSANGRPVIKNTRNHGFQHSSGFLSPGLDRRVLQSFPTLKSGDILACIAYAQRQQKQSIPPIVLTA